MSVGDCKWVTISSHISICIELIDWFLISTSTTSTHFFCFTNLIHPATPSTHAGFSTIFTCCWQAEITSKSTLYIPTWEEGQIYALQRGEIWHQSYLTVINWNLYAFQFIPWIDEQPLVFVFDVSILWCYLLMFVYLDYILLPFHCFWRSSGFFECYHVLYKYVCSHPIHERDDRLIMMKQW